ncbi:BRCT domain-containing protein [Mycena capillaripes]|nr:BRCT domain-containing protein [Mycena capillaripes]
MTFEGVRYHLSATIPSTRRVEISRLLKTHHATRANSVFDATHIITNSEVFQGGRDVDEEKVSIVSELWVERSIAAKQIQKACHYSVSREKLFSGVIACSAGVSLPGKTIGTLSWLLDMQATGLPSGPRDRILHFPTPPGPVGGFSKHKISITNYTGEAREYLKKLIVVMGGKFTPTLNTDNTVLVAAYLGGLKTDKAAEWSITIVNHNWLEDCVVRWLSLNPVHPEYISYPPGVDFGSTVGERGVDPDIEDIVDSETQKRPWIVRY